MFRWGHLLELDAPGRPPFLLPCFLACGYVMQAVPTMSGSIIFSHSLTTRAVVSLALANYLKVSMLVADWLSFIDTLMLWNCVDALP
jgi:hypothetical protein